MNRKRKRAGFCGVFGLIFRKIPVNKRELLRASSKPILFTFGTGLLRRIFISHFLSVLLVQALVLLSVPRKIHGQTALADSLHTYIFSERSSESTVNSIVKYVKQIPDSLYHQFTRTAYPDLQELNGEYANTQLSKYFFLTGSFELHNEHFIEALRNYLTSESFLTGHESIFLEYSIRHMLGTCYFRLAYYSQIHSLYQEAVKQLEEGIRIMKDQRGNEDWLLETHIMLANTYLEIDSTSQAETHYCAAESLAENIGDVESMLRARVNRGNLYSTHQIDDFGESLIRESLAFADSIDYGAAKAYCYLNLSETNYSKKNYGEALRYSELAFSHAEENGISLVMSKSRFEAAEMLQTLGDKTKAADYYRQSLQYVDKDRDMQQVQQSYMKLADISLENKNFKEARGYQGRLFRMVDSFYLAESADKVRLLEQYHELESTTFMNKLLDQENKLNQEQLLRARIIIIFAISGIILLTILIVIELKRRQSLKALYEYIIQKNRIIESQSDEISLQNESLLEYKNHLEELVEERTEALNNALEMAQESNRLKSAFLQNISHEIRTPMNAIIGFTRIMKESRNSEDQSSFMEVITNSSNDLLDIVSKIIKASRMEAASQHLELETFTSGQLNNALESKIGEYINKRGKKESIEFQLDLEAYEGEVRTDLKKLQSVLNYLVDNACKFTSEGRISVSTSTNPEMLFISISDTGVGIPPEKQQIVFDSFEKLEDPYEMKPGIGLGLSITRLLVQSLHGKISLHSLPGEGTTVSLSFPRDPGHQNT